MTSNGLLSQALSALCAMTYTLLHPVPFEHLGVRTISSCQEALLRGNATKELNALQQAAAEAGSLLETTRRSAWGNALETRERTAIQCYSIIEIFEFKSWNMVHCILFFKRFVIPVFQIPGVYF